MSIEHEIFITNSSSPKPAGFFEMSDIYTNSLSPNTKRAYTKDIMEFFDVDALSYITIAQIKSVTASTAREFIDELIGKGRAKSTINRKLTSMSSFYRFLCRKEIGIMDFNPFDTNEGAKRMKQNKQYSNTRCLTKEEVQQVVRITMQGETLEALRNRIVVLLLATTGMRREEIVKIRIGDIRMSHGYHIIEITGKGEKERLIKVNDTIKTFIDKYIEMRGLSYKSEHAHYYLLTKHTRNASYFGGENESLTPQSIYNIIKKVADKAGIHAEDVSPHSFRHTFVTEALSLGVKLEDVADMAGHSSLATTRRYDHTQRVLKNNPADKLTSMFMEE